MRFLLQLPAYVREPSRATTRRCSPVAGTFQHVDAVVRVPRVRVDLLGLLVPGVDPVPVEGHVLLDVLPLREWVHVAPDGVLGHPIARPDAPVGSVTLVWAMRLVVG